MNTAYCNEKSRERVMEVIAWSFNCLRCMAQIRALFWSNILRLVF